MSEPESDDGSTAAEVRKLRMLITYLVIAAVVIGVAVLIQVRNDAAEREGKRDADRWVNCRLSGRTDC